MVSVTDRGAKPSNPASVAWFIGPWESSRISTLARPNDKPAEDIARSTMRCNWWCNSM
jgi:hypothetical protein